MGQQTFKLSNEERMRLVEHYDFYSSLISGDRQPKNPAQRHFIAVAQGIAEIVTVHERAWTNFRQLMSLTKMRERDVVEGGFRLAVVIHDKESDSKTEEEYGKIRVSADIDLSELEMFGEGVPSAGWFSDEGWRRMRAGYRFDSRRGPG